MGAPIAVCILNFNGEKLLRQFLPSITRFTPHDLGKVYVIDNCSTDGSIEFLKNEYPNVAAIETGKNLGFTGGYNVGLSHIAAKYYVLINSDVEVTERWLEPIYELMEAHPNIAACQPKIKAYKQKDAFEYAGAAGGFIDVLGYPFCRGRIFESLEIDNGQYDDALQVFWASGACMFIRADLFHESGGFDLNFFAHMEEIDLCWRLQRMGYTIFCEPKSLVYHVGGETLSKLNPRKTFLNFRNSAGMLYKNTPDRSIYWKFPVKMLLDLLAAFKFWKDNSFAHFTAVIKAYIAFFADINTRRLVRKALKKELNKDVPTTYPRLIAWDYYWGKKKGFNKLKSWH